MSRSGSQRGVVLGSSLRQRLARRAERDGKSISGCAVDLIRLCAKSERPPPLDPVRGYLDDATGTSRFICSAGRREGRITMYAPDDIWAQVDKRAAHFGESKSESVRALIYGGLTVEYAMGVEVRSPGDIAPRQAARKAEQLGLPGNLGVIVVHRLPRRPRGAPQTVAGTVAMVEHIAAARGLTVTVSGAA